MEFIFSKLILESSTAVLNLKISRSNFTPNSLEIRSCSKFTTAVQCTAQNPGTAQKLLEPYSALLLVLISQVDPMMPMQPREPCPVCVQAPICAPGLHGAMGATRGGRRASSSGRVPQDSYVMQYGPAGRQIQMIEVCTHKFKQTSGPNYRLVLST